MNSPDPDVWQDDLADTEMTDNPDGYSTSDVDDYLASLVEPDPDLDVAGMFGGEPSTDAVLDDMMRVRALLLGSINRRLTRHARQTVQVQAQQAVLDRWLAKETDGRLARVVELERAITERATFRAEQLGLTTVSTPWGTVKVTAAEKRTDWVWPTRVAPKAALCAQLADIDADTFTRTTTTVAVDANAVKKHAIVKDGFVWLAGEQLVEVAVPAEPKVVIA